MTPVTLVHRYTCLPAALLGAVLLLPAGCASDDGDDTSKDAGSADAGAVADGGDEDSGGDASGADSSAEDAGEASYLRTYRAIGGVSMGANGVNLAVTHPGMFDVVSGLGGYIDLPYMISTALRLQMAGPCPLEELEAHVAKHGADSLNDPATSPWCGPGLVSYEYENAQDFNQMYFDDNGAKFDREFYWEVFQNLTMALGNFTAAPNPDSPFLPAGVTPTILLDMSPKERCANAGAIPAELSYNLEYNPDAAYPVRPACDGKPVTAGLDPATFDPAGPNDTPIDILLYVDINNNGRRDFAEPLFLNPYERFEDTGADGCFDAREDGNGGCLADGAPDATGDDPNGDNYDWWTNAAGTEGDQWRVDGEPWADDGLDGVPGTGDDGEGNGTFDATPAYWKAEELDATLGFLRMGDDELERLDVYLDGGIRDPLHTAAVMRRVIGALQARTGDAAHYKGIAGFPGSFQPEIKLNELMANIQDVDFSREAMGRHVYMEYGNPNATPEQIEEGDGKHVGTTGQVLARVVLYFIYAAWRLDDPDLEIQTEDRFGSTENGHFYSPGLKARRWYNILLPPGYYLEENKDRRYPVVYFLHGLGQDFDEMAPAGILTGSLMADGLMPKVILVFPDGRCCHRHQSPDGKRHCACDEQVGKGKPRLCIDPACTAADQDSCGSEEIYSNELLEECHSGSLWYDLQSDKWGQPRDDMKYQAMIGDLIDVIDARYRTRKPSAP